LLAAWCPNKEGPSRQRPESEALRPLEERLMWAVLSERNMTETCRIAGGKTGQRPGKGSAAVEPAAASKARPSVA
jgi:hypothetical protein